MPPLHRSSLPMRIKCSWMSSAERMSAFDQFFLGSLAASTQSCWKSPGKLALSPTCYLQLNPVCPRLPGLKWRGLSGPPAPPPHLPQCCLPPFKNISWTISMWPHPGQLLLLTNYRLCNPVTHQGFGSSRNRQGFQGMATEPRANSCSRVDHEGRCVEFVISIYLQILQCTSYQELKIPLCSEYLTALYSHEHYIIIDHHISLFSPGRSWIKTTGSKVID